MSRSADPCACRYRHLSTYASWLPAQLLADFHEGEAEEVQAAPAIGVFDVFVVAVEADAPDGVDGGRFDEDLVAGAEEVFLQLAVLAELRQVAVHHRRQ